MFWDNIHAHIPWINVYKYKFRIQRENRSNYMHVVYNKQLKATDIYLLVAVT